MALRPQCGHGDGRRGCARSGARAPRGEVSRGRAGRSAANDAARGISGPPPHCPSSARRPADSRRRRSPHGLSPKPSPGGAPGPVSPSNGIAHAPDRCRGPSRGPRRGWRERRGRTGVSTTDDGDRRVRRPGTGVAHYRLPGGHSCSKWNVEANTATSRRPIWYWRTGRRRTGKGRTVGVERARPSPGTAMAYRVHGIQRMMRSVGFHYRRPGPPYRPVGASQGGFRNRSRKTVVTGRGADRMRAPRGRVDRNEEGLPCRRQTLSHGSVRCAARYPKRWKSRLVDIRHRPSGYATSSSS